MSASSSNSNDDVKPVEDTTVVSSSDVATVETTAVRRYRPERSAGLNAIPEAALKAAPKGKFAAKGLTKVERPALPGTYLCSHCHAPVELRDNVPNKTQFFSKLICGKAEVCVADVCTTCNRGLRARINKDTSVYLSMVERRKRLDEKKKTAAVLIETNKHQVEAQNAECARLVKVIARLEQKSEDIAVGDDKTMTFAEVTDRIASVRAMLVEAQSRSVAVAMPREIDTSDLSKKIAQYKWKVDKYNQVLGNIKLCVIHQLTDDDVKVKMPALKARSVPSSAAASVSVPSSAAATPASAEVCGEWTADW